MRPQTRTYDRDQEVVARRVRQHWREYPEEFATHILGNEPYGEQLKICRAVARGLAGTGPSRICVKSGHKTGKAGRGLTPVPTPQGWKRHGDLKVGDQVYDERGQPCNIVATIPWKSRPLMRVVFEDGTHIDVDENHEWVVRTRESRKRTHKPPLTLETWQLAESLTVPNGKGADGLPRRITNFTVDLPEPVQLPSRELPVDPYLLGVWLGDGSKIGGEIATPDLEIQAAFVTQMRELGVYDNKHVPEQYLWASAEQRLALLQGLMDTDGTADGRGKGFVEFTNTNKRLADAVLHLARSLGIKARIHERRAKLNGLDYGPVWDVSWNSPAPVFRLPRQLAKLRTTREKKANAHKRLAIVDVYRIPEVEDVQCIEVDSPSHLYLMGESMVPTHNSNTAAFLSLWFPIVYPGGKVVLTAEAGHQVENIIWPEVRRLYNAATDRGMILAPGRLSPSPRYGWRIDGGGGIVAVTPEKPVGMAGLSAPKQLFVIDEASEYDRTIYEAVCGNMMTGGVILALGNPTWPGGWFYEAFEEPDDGGVGIWEPLTISSLDSPNVITGEAVIPGLASKAEIISAIYEHLRVRLDADIPYAELKAFVESTDDPFINVRILGRFASQTSTTAIPLVVLRKSAERWRDEKFEGPLQIGVDPAWMGPDRSVLAPRRGKRIDPLVQFRGLDGPALAGKIVNYVEENRRYGETVKVVVEMMGVGVSCYDHLNLIAEHNNIEVIGVNTSVPSFEQERYNNLRSQLHFDFREWMELGGAIPPDKELENEAATPRCVPDRQNRKTIEDKKLIMQRLGRSPDKLMACLMATYRHNDSEPLDDTQLAEAFSENIDLFVGSSELHGNETIDNGRGYLF